MCRLDFWMRMGHGCEDVRQAHQDTPRGAKGTISVYVGFILGIYVIWGYVLLFCSHFGCQNDPQIGIGTFLGSHALPRRPLERPGVPFGRIWESFWGNCWVTLGAKITPETMPKKQ